jgi:tetratricopeptide (TPR) repeat protein
MFGDTRVAGHYVSPRAYEHFLRSQIASQAGRHEEAADELRRALVSDGSSAYLRTGLAEELLALGRLDEARNEIEIAVRLDPGFADAYVDLGRIARLVQDPGGAERAYRRAVALGVSEETAYLELASLYAERGEAARAAEVQRQLVQRFPGSADAHYVLAEGMLGRGDLARAESELRAALAIDPDHVEACRELGRLLLADGRVDQAAEVVKVGYLRTGQVLLAGLWADVEVAAGHPEAAEAIYGRLVEGPRRPIRVGSQAPGAERTLAVGWLLVERHQGGRALAMLDEFGKREPEVSTQPAWLLLRGAALAEAGQTAAALAAWRRVPQTAGESVQARCRAARLLAREGRFSEALAELGPALEPAGRQASLHGAGGPAQPPRDEELLATQAEIEERSGHGDEARRRLEVASRERPEAGALRYALARVLVRAGDWEQAVATVRPLVERRADDVVALGFLGYTLAEQGARLEEARRLLETAATLQPLSGEAAHHLGWLHFKAGALGEAKRYLLRAARLLGDAPEVQAHLGALYLQEGDRPRALEAYRRALAGQPEEPLRRVVEEQVLRLDPGAGVRAAVSREQHAP